MYTHFGHGYFDQGHLDDRFRSVMQRLGQRNGWFVPVGVLLRYLETQGNGKFISSAERGRLERQWLWNKIFSRHHVSHNIKRHGNPDRSLYCGFGTRCTTL